MSGVERIAAERQRQTEREGWTPEHDAGHHDEELALAAMSYARPRRMRKFPGRGGGSKAYPPPEWPWHPNWWKPADRIRELEKAGALIAAEIDRLLAREPRP